MALQFIFMSNVGVLFNKVVCMYVCASTHSIMEGVEGREDSIILHWEWNQGREEQEKRGGNF